MGRSDDARKQYSAALEVMPDNVEAREGLERVGGLRQTAAKVKATTGGFRSLFSRTQEPVEEKSDAADSAVEEATEELSAEDLEEISREGAGNY